MDLIVLIFLVLYIGRKAKEKGLNPGPWKLRLVLIWLLFEVAGFLIGAQLFQVNINSILTGKMDDLSGLSLFSFACAFGGYLIIKYKLDKTPSDINDEIDDIGKS